MEKRISEFSFSPKISLIMPVYCVDPIYLKAAVDSVRSQIYQNWQLCIVDDCSGSKEIAEILSQYARVDQRIVVKTNDVNLHISAASNVALSLCNGEFVGFVDHDDLLPQHALYAMVEAINDTPSVKILYSDEDKVDRSLKRKSPHFKPDFNRDLLYSYNYICHFTLLESDLLKTIGGFRVGFEGCQDYDLMLRAVTECDFKSIVHVPHVLYHWRMIDGSTSARAEMKEYAKDAGKKALESHFDSLGKTGVEVLPGPHPTTYRIRRPVPASRPLVSLIIPTRNALQYLKPCVESILEKTDYENYEILIVDNQSDDEATLQWLNNIQQDSRVRVISYDQEFNYSAINNFAVSQAKGQVVGLINNDVEVISKEWLSEMVSNVMRPEVGCVGAKLLYEDDTVQHAGVILGLGGVAGHAFKYFDRYDPGYVLRARLQQNYSAVTAACLLVRKEVFQQAGGLDEVNFKVAFNDVDFCLKVRSLGLDNVWTPWAELYHYESKSRGMDDTPAKAKRFQKEVAAMKLRWSKELKSDPAYSVNLTDLAENFAIRG